jgi:hypothetical protein
MSVKTRRQTHVRRETEKREVEEELPRRYGEEIADDLMAPVLAEDPLFRESLKKNVDPRVAYIEYMVNRGDPFVMDILAKAVYTRAVATYLDYLLRHNKPLKRKYLMRLAEIAKLLGFREDTGRWCCDLYKNGFIAKEGLPWMARMDKLPQYAETVILHYDKNGHEIIKYLKVED